MNKKIEITLTEKRDAFYVSCFQSLELAADDKREIIHCDDSYSSLDHQISCQDVMKWFRLGQIYADCEIEFKIKSNNKYFLQNIKEEVKNG